MASVRNASFVHALLTLLLALPAAAQTVLIGGPGTPGCQSSAVPPQLSDGIPADGTIHYSYDGILKHLTLVVANTTTVPDPSWKTPTITRVGFNLPASVTGASLLSQSAAGGATPDWSLSAGPAQLGGCLGTFSRQLIAGGPGIQNGIAKPGTNMPGPANTAVIGPMAFVIQIDTVALLTAQDFIDSKSDHPVNSVTAAFRFQGSGPDGQGSGFIGSASDCTTFAASTDIGPSCHLPLDPVLTATPPVVGQMFTISLTADAAFADALVFWVASYAPVTPWTDPVSGCTVYVDVFHPWNFFIVDTYFTDQDGDWSLSFMLPNLPALVGVEMIFQLRVCAPNGPQGPLDPDWLSNGLFVRIGCL